MQQTSTVTLSSSTTPILLQNNASNGIYVTDQAKLVVDGDADAGTIVATGNNIGVFFQHVAGGVLPTSEIKGLVSKSNTTSGMQLNGGSAVRVRGSTILANYYGVLVMPGSVSGFENDVSRMDLGTDTSNEAGGNALQDKTAGAGGTPNTGAGLCVSIQPNKSQQLKAMGNRFATLAGTGVVDCKTAAANTSIGGSANCSGGANLAGQGRNGNTISLNNCVE
jgi:hypothetical protein